MALIVALCIGVFSPGALAQDEGPARVFDVSLEGVTLSEVASRMYEYRLYLLAFATVLVLLFLWIADVLQPGGMAKVGLRDVKPHAAPMWLFAGLVVFSCQVFAVSGIKGQAWLGVGDDSLRSQSIMVMGGYGVGLIASFGMVYLFSRSAPKAGLSPRFMDVPIAAACLLLALPAVHLASELAILVHKAITNEMPESLAHPTLQAILSERGNPWAWGLAAGAVIGAPVVEEVVYRVFFQSALLRWFGSPWMAVLGTAALFTAMHAVGEGAIPYHALATIGTLGVAMGLAYERTRRLGVPILMHVGFNALNVAIAMRVAG